ncbi:TPR repeat domain-containing protein [Ditylenchus destructor]|nr:TPR repeat domain-containing protein [Ditylenchus destructor]
MSGVQPPQDESKPSIGKVTNDEKNLAISILQFLRHKMFSGQCTDDQIEGLEVAVQSLETAFNVSDLSNAFQPSKPLLEIFVSAEGLSQPQEQFPTPTVANKLKADKLNKEGNVLVARGQLDEAIEKYNEAIKLNEDPIYFCERAGALCRMGQYELSIQDCRTALALDPTTYKAYRRMGMVFTIQNRYDQAIDAYKHYLVNEPNNEQCALMMKHCVSLISRHS